MSEYVFSIAFQSSEGNITSQKMDYLSSHQIGTVIKNFYCVGDQIHLYARSDEFCRYSGSNSGVCFALIEGVFYVDFEKGTLERYRQDIRNWLENEVRFDSSDISFGDSYVPSSICSKSSCDNSVSNWENVVLAAVNEIPAFNKKSELCFNRNCFEKKKKKRPRHVSQQLGGKVGNTMELHQKIELNFGVKLDCLEIADSHRFCLKDIDFKLANRQYLVHQGNCVHHMYLYDVHLYNPIYDPHIEDFPGKVFLSRMARRICAVCEIKAADYVILGDRLAESYVILYCRECFCMLHYNSSGDILYNDFTLLPYIHDSV